MRTRAFIQAFRSRLRAVVAIDYSCWFVVLGGTTLFYVGMLDFLTTYNYIPLIPPFPWALRLLFLLSWLVLIGFITWRRFLRPMAQDFSDANLARIAERRLPGIDGRMFTELDGIAMNEDDRRQLDGLLDGKAIGGLVPASRLRFLVRSACAVFLGILAWTWYYPGYVQKAVRNFFTLSNEFPQNTLLSAALADRVVATDRSLVVRVRREREEAPVVLSWRNSRGDSDRRYLPAHRRMWNEAFDFREDQHGTYRLTAAAGPRANEVHLKGWVVRRPAIGGIESVLTPPAYVNAHGEERVKVQRIGSLAAKGILPGTTCRFSIDLVDEAIPEDDELTVERVIGIAVDGSPIPFERAGGSLTGSFTILGPCEVEVTLVTAYSVAGERTYRIGADPEPRYRISVEDDAKPSVHIEGLRSREEVGPRAVLDLGVAAVDDYGLARLSLLHQVIDAKGKGLHETHQALRQFEGILGRTETTQRHTLDLGAEPLAALAVPGTTIELVAEAADGNDVTGPGIGRSTVVQIPIITEEELQTKLDNILHDARERIHQAREHLGKGLREPEDLKQASRNAQVAARRSHESIESVARRWRQNQLKDTMQQVLDDAHAKMAAEAMPRLATAAFEPGEQATEAAQQAEKALSEVEEMLGRMLRSDDLERELQNLKLKQQALTEKARRHALEAMTGTGGDEQEAKDLQGQQDALADALKEWERKLDANQSTSPAFEKARETVRQERPSDRLDRAADMLGQDGSGKQQAVEQMDAAGKTMNKLLDQLKGGRETDRIAKNLREAAGQERDLGNRVEDGERPQDLEQAQRDLEEAVGELEQELDQEDPAQTKAAQNVQGARQAMENAARAMAQGNSQQAAAEASAAAGLLEQAAEELEGQDQQQQQKQPQGADVLALLKELKKAQGAILRKGTALHEKMVAAREQAGRDVEDPELDFFETRTIKELAEAQAGVQLRLREEGIKELEQDPIAKRALVRVDTAVDRSAKHLATPALGEMGVKRIKLAYYRICRLLEVATDLPELEKEEGGGGNSPGQGGNQAPFPPRAVMALLVEEQFQISRRAAANRLAPGDVQQDQKQLNEAMSWLVEHMRPGSRPQLLMKRALRAALSADYELQQGRRGTVCRNEMDAALMALRRMLEEGKEQQSNNQNPQQQPRDNQGQDQQQSQNQQQNPGQNNGGNAGGNEAPNQAEGVAQVAETAQRNSALMQLRPETRERLLEPAALRLSPGAYRHYQSYLEFLESRQ